MEKGPYVTKKKRLDWYQFWVIISITILSLFFLSNLSALAFLKIDNNEREKVIQTNQSTTNYEFQFFNDKNWACGIDTDGNNRCHDSAEDAGINAFFWYLLFIDLGFIALGIIPTILTRRKRQKLIPILSLCIVPIFLISCFLILATWINLYAG